MQCPFDLHRTYIRRRTLWLEPPLIFMRGYIGEDAMWQAIERQHWTRHWWIGRCPTSLKPTSVISTIRTVEVAVNESCHTSDTFVRHTFSTAASVAKWLRKREGSVLQAPAELLREHQFLASPSTVTPSSFPSEIWFNLARSVRHGACRHSGRTIRTSFAEHDDERVRIRPCPKSSSDSLATMGTKQQRFAHAIWELPHIPPHIS